MEEFPSNSKSAPQGPPEKKIESVVTGKVIQKSTPPFQRLIRTFFSGSAKNAFAYAVDNVLVPSAQKMFLEAVHGGMERMVYREPVAGGFRQGQPQSRGNWTSYGIFSSPGSSTVSPKERMNPLSPIAAQTHDFGQIILEDRISAERVITGLYDLLNAYEVVSVSDFYSLIGQTPAYTDQKYGWTDLRGSDIRMVPQGYQLILPKPTPI